jgi:hypothetical protein
MIEYINKIYTSQMNSIKELHHSTSKPYKQGEPMHLQTVVKKDDPDKANEVNDSHPVCSLLVAPPKNWCPLPNCPIL